MWKGWERGTRTLTTREREEDREAGAQAVFEALGVRLGFGRQAHHRRRGDECRQAHDEGGARRGSLPLAGPPTTPSAAAAAAAAPPIARAVCGVLGAVFLWGGRRGRGTGCRTALHL